MSILRYWRRRLSPVAPPPPPPPAPPPPPPPPSSLLDHSSGFHTSNPRPSSHSRRTLPSSQSLFSLRAAVAAALQPRHSTVIRTSTLLLNSGHASRHADPFTGTPWKFCKSLSNVWPASSVRCFFALLAASPFGRNSGMSCRAWHLRQQPDRPLGLDGVASPT
jgi:hypothetical protein